MIIPPGSAMFSPTTAHRAQGFSLIELMVVLAIIAIVATVAIPSYQNSMASNRMTSAANNLLGAMQFARSEAVTRRTGITVCASSDGSSCGADWGDGGIVRTTAGVVLRTIPAVSDVTIAGEAVTFRSDGRLPEPTPDPLPSISITADGVSTSRKVEINVIGHSKIEAE
jgi:type IV fimbrial biogenesis protein FimT